MTRFIERDARKPFVLRPADIAARADGQGNLWVCGCGLSAEQPFCDGTHKLVAKEPSGTFHYARAHGALVRREAALVPGSPPERLAPEA